jgi:hypothetical protein
MPRLHSWTQLALILILNGLFTLTTAPALASSHIIHVDQAATGTNDGSNWVDAYIDLQDALASASAGDEIWVATGLYKPTDGSDRTASFQLKFGVEVYGGFNGDEIDRHQREWQNNLTVLSGDIDGNDTTDANGIVMNVDDIAGNNSYHVATGSGTNETAILDGFVITAGSADGTSTSPCNQRCGGGFYNVSGSPTLSRIRFIGNAARLSGGGMYNLSSNPILSNIDFRGNSSAGGAGVRNESSNPVMTNISFSQNRAIGSGGGMSNSDSSPIITNAIFIDNHGAFGGGGMVNSDNSNPVLTNLTLLGNSTDSSGGAISNFNSNPEIRNSIVWNNWASGDTGTVDASISNGNNSTPTISHSLVQACNPDDSWNNGCGADAGNNLADVDPMFVQEWVFSLTQRPNLRLQADSPAINAGNSSIVDPLASDLDGNVRIADDIVDLGPYERPTSSCPADGIAHVSPQSSEPGDGETWDSAYRNLQDALVIEENCEIWVVAGVYKPSRSNYDLDTFRLGNGHVIYGGFAGGETERNQRDWVSNFTVLSGDIDNNDVTDEHGIVTNSDDVAGRNSETVVRSSSTVSSAILDGFTITAGADGWQGGGMTNTGSPTLINIRFIGNSTYDVGGGLYNAVGSPNLINVSFVNNSAILGGGVYNTGGSSPSLENVIFTGNTAIQGGGMFNFESTPVLDSVVFSENSADSAGGGLVNNSNSYPVLTNVIFSANDADYGGAMINASGSHPELLNVVMRGNTARESGGGMLNLNSNPTLTNVEVIGNSAQSFGGGMHNASESDPILTNVTFAGNDAGLNGGAISNAEGSNPVIRNSIVWNNRDQSGPGTTSASIFNKSSDPVFSHSLVQGCNQEGFWTFVCGMDDGTALHDADPLFFDPADPGSAPATTGDARLQAGSPAIDAGNDSYVFAIASATDLDGNPRKFGDAVDLGPYEYFELPDMLFEDRFETDSP